MNLDVKARKHSSAKLLEVRSLTPADFDLLRGKSAIPKFTLRTLRDRHHHIAWLIALGKPRSEIAAECRMSPERVSVISQSPAMLDLINRYRAEIEASRLEALRDFGARAAQNMAMAETLLTSELQAVVDGTRETPTLRDLNRIATDRMDRFGYGKSSKLDVNVDFGRKLEAAIARASSINRPKVIEHE